jgi:hypothetical protein
MTHLCSLTFEWRPCSDWAGVLFGAMVIDGRELSRYLPRSLGDRRQLPPALQRPWAGAAAYVESLLLRGPAVFGIDRKEPSRRELLICPCGDFGCGCVSAEVAIADGVVRWRRFAYHRECAGTTPLGMGELHFPLPAYEAGLLGTAAVAVQEAALKRAREERERQALATVPPTRCPACGRSLRQTRPDGRCVGCGAALRGPG